MGTHRLPVLFVLLTFFCKPDFSNCVNRNGVKTEFILQFKQAVYKQTMKLFAELEIKRKEREAKEMHERYGKHPARAAQALHLSMCFLTGDKES